MLFYDRNVNQLWTLRVSKYSMHNLRPSSQIELTEFSCERHVNLSQNHHQYTSMKLHKYWNVDKKDFVENWKGMKNLMFIQIH